MWLSPVPDGHVGVSSPLPMQAAEGSIPDHPHLKAWITEGPIGSGPPLSLDQHWAWPAMGAQQTSAFPGLSLETLWRELEFGEERSRNSIISSSSGSLKRMETLLAPVLPGRVIRGNLALWDGCSAKSPRPGCAISGCSCRGTLWRL